MSSWPLSSVRPSAVPLATKPRQASGTSSRVKCSVVPGPTSSAIGRLRQRQMRRPLLRGDEAARRGIGRRVAAAHRLQPRASGQAFGHGIGQRLGQIGDAQHHLAIVEPGQRVGIVGAG